MMINKRLIATVAESKKYIAGNVASQWVSLCSNVVIMGSIAAFVGKLAYAKPQANDHDFIMGLPDGYDTVMGEGGASISGGEKQRISIARAIMKNAPIIILDEATANVDPENEKELVEAIDALTKEKTIIMIAHRLKTVRNADQIAVVENGKSLSSAHTLSLCRRAAFTGALLMPVSRRQAGKFSNKRYSLIF